MNHPMTKQDILEIEFAFRALQWRRLRTSLIVLAVCVLYCIISFACCFWVGFVIGSVCILVAVWRMMNYVPMDWTVVTGARSWLVSLKY